MINALRITLARVGLRLIYGASLIFFSIRDFLFGNGLYIFRDWTWPLSTSLPPIATFSPEIVRNVGPDPMGFVRMFVNWPIVVIDNMTGDPIMAEKAYVIYFFALFISLFFILGQLLLHLLDQVSGEKLSPTKGELFVFTVVFVCFVNFWCIQQLSDLYYTAILEFTLIAISAALVLRRESTVRNSLLPGALIALCVFLDPNLYPYGLLVVATCIFARSVVRPRSFNNFRSALTRIVVVIGVTIPALLTILYTFSISTGTSLRPAGYYLQSTTNLSLANALRLLGFSWSLIAYAPPTLLAGMNNITQLGSLGTPPFILLPSGGLTTLWLITTWTVPVLAFGINAASRFRKLTVPISFTAIVGLLFTQPSIFPFPFLLATQLRGAPVLGGALVTFLAIPDHALVVVAVSYTMLISTVVYCILSRDVLLNLAKITHSASIQRIFRHQSPSIRQAVPLAILILLLAFQGWQFFSGSFYPSGFVWGESGNGVSSVGAFAPSHPPPAMVETYNWLYSQPDNFNIYWPGPSGASYSWSPKATGSIATQDSPKPTVFPRALPFLLSEGLTADVSDYLASLNVKYVVVQPFSTIAMQLWWGVNDANTLNRILAHTPGIKVVREAGEITVYGVDNTWGTMYSSPVVTSYNLTDLRYALAYRVFSSLGTRIVLTTPTTTPNRLCIDDLTCTYSIVSPTELGFNGLHETDIRTLNDSSVNWQSFDLGANDNRMMPSPWNAWLVTNWGPSNALVGIQDGYLSWTFNETRSYLSLSYNGTVTSGKPGGIPIPLGSAVAVSVEFSYRTSSTFDGKVQVVLPQLTNSSSWIEDTASPAMPASTQWTQGSFNDTLPFNTAYFTTRFIAEASVGWVEIRNVRVNLVLLQEDLAAPFGYTLAPQTGDLDLGFIPGYAYIEYRGIGSLQVNGETFNLSSPETASWYALPYPNISSTVSGVSIRALVVSKTPLSISLDSTSDGGWTPSINVRFGGAVVFTRPFALGYSLHSSPKSYSSHPTLDGVNLFLDVTPGMYTVSLQGTSVARIAYFTTLGFILGILADTSRASIKVLFRKIKRERSSVST